VNGRADEPQPAEYVTVRHWQRFGFDRLYGHTADGRNVGWVDLDTGEGSIELPGFAAAFERAVEAWTYRHPANARVPHGVRAAPHSDWPGRGDVEESSAEATSSATSGSWLDLADNRAGAAVRAKALEARRDEPVWTLLARVAGLHTEERAWRLGAKGEELVGKGLAKLGPRWHVLHSIPIGDSADIDHLVIGPAGVFSLNAKHHKYATVSVESDVVTVNGHPHPYVEESRHEARHVGRVLSEAIGASIAAHGVVVVVNAGSFTVRRQPEDVIVTDRRRLQPWLLSLSPAFLIRQARRHSSKWLDGRRPGVPEDLSLARCAITKPSAAPSLMDAPGRWLISSQNLYVRTRQVRLRPMRPGATDPGARSLG